MRGTCRNAFVAARLPGHHAGVSGVALHAPSQGFCLLNHVAIGARYALRTHPRLARVAIFDFDVHHGNGTQEIFADDPSVLFVSVHVHDISRDPNRAFFPTTGAATAAEGEAMAHGGAEQANGGSSSDSGSGSGGADSGAEGSGEGVGEGVGEGGECGGCSGGGANIVNAHCHAAARRRRSRVPCWTACTASASGGQSSFCCPQALTRTRKTHWVDWTRTGSL